MVFKCHSRTLLLCFDLCVCVKLLSHFVLTDLWGRKVAFGFGFCYIWFWRLYASKIFVDGNFEVEGNLNYNPNATDTIVQMANDEYYGSDFAKIHQVIEMLFNQGFFTVKCADFVRPSDLVNDFDNGNWETGYEDWQPQAEKFKYINICFAIHSLNAYHPYSIPDILRMNNFEITVTIKQTV